MVVVFAQLGNFRATVTFPKGLRVKRFVLHGALVSLTHVPHAIGPSKDCRKIYLLTAILYFKSKCVMASIV